MAELPYRTDQTALTDDELILLDELFHAGATLRLLRRESFREQWNVGYTHSLELPALEATLQRFCAEGILEHEQSRNRTYFQMTPHGGELWSRERCPVWERYCTECYKETVRGQAITTVVAVSPQIRDDFLALWPIEAIRFRKRDVPGDRFVRWHPFERLYAGFALGNWPGFSEAWQTIEPNRTWWRSVKELQRFVARKS